MRLWSVSYRDTPIVSATVTATHPNRRSACFGRVPSVHATRQSHDHLSRNYFNPFLLFLQVMLQEHPRPRGSLRRVDPNGELLHI
jgi:hypothetical protein